MVIVFVLSWNLCLKYVVEVFQFFLTMVDEWVTGNVAAQHFRPSSPPQTYESFTPTNLLWKRDTWVDSSMVLPDNLIQFSEILKNILIDSRKWLEETICGPFSIC